MDSSTHRGVERRGSGDGVPCGAAADPARPGPARPPHHRTRPHRTRHCSRRGLGPLYSPARLHTRGAEHEGRCSALTGGQRRARSLRGRPELFKCFLRPLPVLGKGRRAEPGAEDAEEGARHAAAARLRPPPVVPPRVPPSASGPAQRSAPPVPLSPPPPSGPAPQRRGSAVLEAAVELPFAALPGPRAALKAAFAEVLLEVGVVHGPVVLRLTVRLRARGPRQPPATNGPRPQHPGGAGEDEGPHRGGGGGRGASPGTGGRTPGIPP